MHKNYSGIRKCLTKVVDFVCRKCDFTDSTEVDEKVKLDGRVIEKVAKFSYQGDDLRSGARNCYCKNKMWIEA